MKLIIVDVSAFLYCSTAIADKETTVSKITGHLHIKLLFGLMNNKF